MSNGVKYRVYLTPLYSSFVYDSEIEISDLVQNIDGTITKSIDSTDFSLGIFNYTDVQLTCDNSNGKFSDNSDSRSYFAFLRDRAKIRIVFDQDDGSPVVTYQGIISDAATTINSDTDELVFTILGPDSVFINSEIPAGAVTDGMTVTQALVAILNTSDIRSVLTLSIANINPSNDFVIDLGARFDKKNKKDAITQLLNASNSVMLIDDDFNIIVKDRTPHYEIPVSYFYGKGDQFGRENIKSISGYNNGLQRTFNLAVVKGGQDSAIVTDVDATPQTVPTEANTGVYGNGVSQNVYGIRQKEITFDFVTNQTTLNAIAQGYVDEFSFPKPEFEMIVSTSIACSINLLDQVSVNYPLLITPAGKFLPIIGITKIGDTDSPLPYTKGSLTVDALLGFKVIEKTENISSYETILKVRNVGVSLYDGGLLVSTSTRTVTSTADGQILVTDDTILLDCTAGNVDLTLPSPTASPQKEYTVIRIDSTTNRGRVLPSASENVSGASSLLLASYLDGARFSTDRTNWWAATWSRQPTSTIPITKFTMANNQSAAADVTALIFDKTLYRTARIRIDIRRKTDTASSEVRATHILSAIYNTQADTWSVTDSMDGDDDGVVFSITSAGQIQYTSTNITGSNGVHNAYFNAELFNV